MRLMHLRLKKYENGRIKVLRDKQATNKGLLIFVNAKMLKEMQERCF